MPSSHDYVGHPLEVELSASARQILDAISHGFRTKVDVKGKMAELFLKVNHLDPLVAAGVQEKVTWHDSDGEPDFELRIRGQAAPLRIECKNARSNSPLRHGGETGPYVEIQKTRNSKDGSNTRSYRVEQFEVLAVCLFNRTGQWEYLFARAADLARADGNPNLLRIMHRVTLEPPGCWTADLATILRGFASEE